MILLPKISKTKHVFKSAVPFGEKAQHSPTKGILKIPKMLKRRIPCRSSYTLMNGAFTTESSENIYVVIVGVALNECSV
jgi:hypothetical protein